MASFKEVWVDNTSVIARRFGDSSRVVIEGDTFDEAGTPVRHVGPQDITDDLTPEQMALLQGWLDQINAMLLGLAEIDESDILPETPIPPPYVPTAPVNEPQPPEFGIPMTPEEEPILEARSAPDGKREG